MNATVLLNDLLAKGITLSAGNGKLYLVGPKGSLTPALKDVVRQHKPELLAILSEQWARKVSALLSTIDDPERRVALRERFEERAAICEFDGNLPRDEAERIEAAESN